MAMGQGIYGYQMNKSQFVPILKGTSQLLFHFFELEIQNFDFDGERFAKIIGGSAKRAPSRR